MINILDEQADRAHQGRKIDPYLISAAIDFFRTYADRTHHGKEEDIFFRELAAKPLTNEHKLMMQELIQEHVLARSMVNSLNEANKLYAQDASSYLDEVVKLLRDVVEFYPQHIKKEDEQFFFPALNYLTQEEQDEMLKDFWEFDRKLIHEKYQKVVEGLTMFKR
jgi:hemerythrin-like domain-containing protein